MRYHLRIRPDSCPIVIAEFNDIQHALQIFITVLDALYQDEQKGIEPESQYYRGVELLDSIYDHEFLPDEVGSIYHLRLIPDDDEMEPIRYTTRDYEAQFPED